MKANTLGELIEYLSKRFDVSYAKLARIVVKTAKWQKEQMMEEWLKDRDGCFWDGVDEGKKVMEEQMLKDAAMVEGNVLELGETYKDLTISVEGKELNEALQPLGVKDGDRVRMIIIKEDNQ